MDWIYTMLDQCLARELMKTAWWRICWNQPGPELFKWMTLCQHEDGWVIRSWSLVGFVCWCWLRS